MNERGGGCAKHYVAEKSFPPVAFFPSAGRDAGQVNTPGVGRTLTLTAEGPGGESGASGCIARWGKTAGTDDSETRERKRPKSAMLRGKIGRLE